MRSMKFSFILPLSQLCIAISLLEGGRRILGPRGLDTIYVSTPTMFCFGLNAPAILFELPVLLARHNPTTNPSALEYHLLELSLVGFTAAQLLFLAGVVVVWFPVGRMIDHYGSPAVHQPSRTTLSRFYSNFSRCSWESLSSLQ